MAVKTINLTGAEVAVTGLDGAHAHIRNDGTEVIYAAKTAGITAGADGVASIPAGQSDTIRGISGAVYLLGTGSVLIQSDDYVASPFKTSAASGGSAVDEVARAAVNTHAGNAEIHVTAEEKVHWNGKADISDIPEALPANGGNSDSVGGKHANELVQFIGKINSATIANNPNYATAYEGNLAPATAVEIGLDSAWYHLKYFRHEDIGTVGWGVQIAIPLTNITILPKYRCAANNETSWSTWHNFADGGNAASVGAYTESDIAALEARIAALEGGTT